MSLDFGSGTSHLSSPSWVRSGSVPRVSEEKENLLFGLFSSSSYAPLPSPLVVVGRKRRGPWCWY